MFASRALLPSSVLSFCPFFLQRSFFIRLTRDNKSEKFFKVFYERMKLAQQEIKATVTVNTSDLGSKRKDEDANDKEAPTKKKGQGLHRAYAVYPKTNSSSGEEGREWECPGIERAHRLSCSVVQNVFKWKGVVKQM